MTEEAERRGFAIGVHTKHGEIVKGYANELLPNGDFFYSNIKVFKDGRNVTADQLVNIDEFNKDGRYVGRQPKVVQPVLTEEQQEIAYG
jgi:hypothetical protein